MTTQKQRVRDYFADTLSECTEDDITPLEVAEIFIEELNDWSRYHKNQYDNYEAIRAALGERVRQA
jgi:hypothetical protein